ncbi:hypothetical protein GCM10025859_27130 [Alicyclobacillus fastidiosus]|nr:hypothetical protein GCM10025859_27130 [Alicyclobacillus fastidiosus]
MSTDLSRKEARGAFYLIENTEPEHVFTPEDLTREHQMIIDTTRAFVEHEVLPVQEQLEHQDWDLTVQLLQKAGELGLLAADVPEDYEGLGADKATSALISEYLTRGDRSRSATVLTSASGRCPSCSLATKIRSESTCPNWPRANGSRLTP